MHRFFSGRAVLCFSLGFASVLMALGVVSFNLRVSHAQETEGVNGAVIGSPSKGAVIAKRRLTGDPIPTLINEIVVNPNGADSNCEYVELIGAPSAALAGLYFASVEGDSNSATGQADLVIDLTAGVLGTNGLLVVTGTDPSGDCDGRNYGAPSGTLVFRFSIFDGGILENGTNSFLLIHSPTTAITPGTDYDTDNNGTLDALPGDATIVDGIGWSDSGAGDIVYGNTELPSPAGSFGNDMATRFPGNTTANSADAWYYGDMTGTANSTTYDTAQVSANFPPDGMLTPGLPNVGTPSSGSAPYDFDGDGKTDASIFRPNPTALLNNPSPEGSTSQWWLRDSATGGLNYAVAFGGPTDLPVAADFTGDGKTDVAFWRPSTGEWFVLRSDDLSFYGFPFGSTGDIPAPGDFDGDGKADAAVYRPSSGTWFILRSSDAGVSVASFGISEDKPVIGDYDGDGKDDIAVYRPSVSEWWLLMSTQGLRAYQFGATGDRTSVGDWTGDGKADVSFYRPSTSEFYVVRSEDDSYFAFPWGSAGDIPVVGDYDGDGKVDGAIFRPSDNVWYILGSTSGFEAIPFGAGGDVPVPSVVSVQ